MAIDSASVATVHQAYSRFLLDELVLFLKVRNLPTSGSHEQLASRLANHDIHTYHFQHEPPRPSPLPAISSSPSKRLPDLPVEIIAYILTILGDWELAQHLDIPAALPCPPDWQQQQQPPQQTPNTTSPSPSPSSVSATDWAILSSGSVQLVRQKDPQLNPPTRLGASLVIRFSLIPLIEFFMLEYPRLFLSMFKADLIPILASKHGRTQVLSWWHNAMHTHPDMIGPPKPESVRDAIDGACRHGAVVSLDWWKCSGLHMEYSEASLEMASSRNHIPVLEWWKNEHKTSGLGLKVGRVMDMASTAGQVDVLEWWASSQIEFKYGSIVLQHASCHGRLDVLRWWLGSGLQLIFDGDVLTGATRYNRPEVLDWWDASGLPVEYRVCDIEEALEDAKGGGAAARAWWERKGVDFNATDKDWMKVRTLN